MTKINLKFYSSLLSYVILWQRSIGCRLGFVVIFLFIKDKSSIYFVSCHYYDYDIFFSESIKSGLRSFEYKYLNLLLIIQYWKKP